MSCSSLKPSANAEILKSAVQPYTEQILTNILNLLSSQKLNKVLAKTLAATLGRIALAMPEQVSMRSGPVIKQWVLSLRMLTASEEREQAYR